MPFPPPPVPSEFTIGDLTAGHARFDAFGVTFYGTDGTTELFRFDFATGTLTFSSLGTGQRIALQSDLLALYTSDPAVGAAIIKAINKALSLRSPQISTFALATIGLQSADGAIDNSIIALNASQVNLAADVISLLAPVIQNSNGQALGWGLADEAHLTANSAQNIGAVSATITGTVAHKDGIGAAGSLQVSANVIQGHAYEIVGFAHLFTSVAGDVVRAALAQSAGGALGFLTPTPAPAWTLPTANRADSRLITQHFYASVGSGPVTFDLTAIRVAGTGNINGSGGSSISIKDVGGY